MLPIMVGTNNGLTRLGPLSCKVSNPFCSSSIPVSYTHLVLRVYEEQAGKNDIVITTAQVPGRPAPLLLTEEAVAGMKPGSVIVDMGVSPLGGNCALSKPGDVVVTDNGVTISGYTDLPGRLPGHASQLFGQNIVNFFKLATPGKDGVLVLDEDDEVIRGITVTLDGTGMWPRLLYTSRCV